MCTVLGHEVYANLLGNNRSLLQGGSADSVMLEGLKGTTKRKKGLRRDIPGW